MISISCLGDFVLGVTAVDQDIGVNGQVTYELAGSRSVRSNFEIDGRTGVITARNRLSQQRYSFTVRASDEVSDRSQMQANSGRLHKKKIVCCLAYTLYCIWYDNCSFDKIKSTLKHNN